MVISNIFLVIFDTLDFLDFNILAFLLNSNISEFANNKSRLKPSIDGSGCKYRILYQRVLTTTTLAIHTQASQTLTFNLCTIWPGRTFL